MKFTGSISDLMDLKFAKINDEYIRLANLQYTNMEYVSGYAYELSSSKDMRHFLILSDEMEIKIHSEGTLCYPEILSEQSLFVLGEIAKKSKL